MIGDVHASAKCSGQHHGSKPEDAVRGTEHFCEGVQRAWHC